MATVVLDVPEEKVHSFVKMVLQLGIDKHRISSSSKKTNLLLFSLLLLQSHHGLAYFHL